MNANGFKNELISLISNCKSVYGIGQTGDINAPLIPGKSDIDLFVICHEVPSKEERLILYKSLEGKYTELNMEVSECVKSQNTTQRSGNYDHTLPYIWREL